jgi:ferric-dicitrate binding protein FerR (iron transport regulator)
VSNTQLLVDLERWSDGTLSAADCQQLEQRLRHDANALAEAQSVIQWNRRLNAWLCPESDIKQAWRPCAAQLSASRRQRIAQRVLRRWDTHRRARWWPLAAAALVAVAITGAWWWRADSDVVRDATGKVWAIGQPQTVTTPAVLRWADGSRCDLATGTRFTLNSVRTVTIANGSVQADIAHQTVGRSLQLTTPQGDVRVIGTRFRIDVGVRSSWIAMDAGVVEVVAGTQHHELGADGLAELTRSGVHVLPSAPPTTPWSATSPIGRLFFTSSGVGTRTNPRSWFDDATIDITTATGLAQFRDLVTRRTDATIAGLAAVGGRHLVINDLEGREGPGGTTYHASPQLLPILAPEMDGLADQMFSRLRQAGITCGVPITHAPGLTPFAAASEMAAIADYATKRWNLGFVVLWRVNPAGGAAGRSEMLAWLQRMRPELPLVIADAQTGDERWGMPMRSLPSAKAKPSEPLPAAMEFLNFTAADRADLSAWLKAGAIPMVNVWFPGPLVDYLDERRRGVTP